MHANLDGYFRAEQENRQRLSGEAAGGWLAEEAARNRRAVHPGAALRRATGTLLVRAGTRLRGTTRATTVPPLPAHSEAGS